MLEVILGAVIAGGIGFLSGWWVMRLQASRTEELTLRLRALELQEPALREIARRLAELDDFRDITFAEPKKPSRDGAGGWLDGSYMRRWEELWAAHDELKRIYRAELRPLLVEEGLNEAIKRLADSVRRSSLIYANVRLGQADIGVMAEAAEKVFEELLDCRRRVEAARRLSE